MATLQGKAVKNTYRQVLQIGASNVGVSGTLQRVQDGAGVNTALSLSTVAATVHGDLTITGDLIITGGGIQIQDLIDDTVASLIQNGTGITWAYNDGARTLTPTITIATADGGVQGDFLQLNTGANEASAVGKLKWNATDGTMDIGLMGGNVVLQVGQEQVIRVVNNTGASLTEAAYQAVRIGSAQGQRLAVLLAQGNNNANSKDTLGLVTETIANNQEGFITTSGLVRQIDTTGDLQTEVWVDGDILYLSPTIAGAVTKVKPIAPQQVVVLGFVVYAHKTQGKIYVKVDNGSDLSELHDVKITSLANNNILKYNSSTALWENVAGTTTNIAEGTNLYYTQGRFDSAFAAKSTTNLAEGTNLYYTQARFDTAFSNKSTTNLAEGSNLYYTQARFNSALAAKTTTDLAEGSNLYYTDTRARLALSSSATGLSYANNSGVFSLTAGYAIPTSVKLGQYDTAYNRSIVSAAVSGTGTKTLSLTQQDANVVSATWTDLGITTINGTANQILATTAGNTTTIAFTNDVTMPNNLVVSGNLTINGTATYVNTQSISAKDPLFEVANDNNTTDAVDIGYYGRYYDTPQTRVEFTGLFRDASDAGKFKFFTGLVDEPTNVVNTTGTGYTVGTLVANFEGNLAGTANAANALSTARTIAASGDAVWSVSFDGSANVSSALTLANTGVTASTYGTSTAVPTIAVDSKGRITSASNTNITFPVTTVNGQAGTVVLTTTNVAEGSNQYFTSARAQSAITGGASSVVTADLTASRALVSDGTGKIAASASTTAIEIGYVAGVTSAIQTQLNAKLNLTGGTLTGALSLGTNTLTSGRITLSTNDQSTNRLTITNSGSGGRSYSIVGGLNGANNSSFSIYDETAASTRFDIASTGAATFSSSIAATSATFSDRVFASKVINSATITNSTNNASLLLYAPTTTNYYGGIIGWAEGNLAASISAYDDGSGGALGLSFSTGNNTTLSERLKIASTGAATFSSSVTATSGNFIVDDAATNSVLDILTLTHTTSGTAASGLGAGILFRAERPSSGIVLNRGAIYGVSGTDPDDNGDLAFYTLTNTGASGFSEKMRIKGSGNVGIGTSSPTAITNYTTLDIRGVNGSAIYLGQTSTPSLRFFGEGVDAYMDNSSTGALIFRTTSSGTERMRITSGGSVGINNTNPFGLSSSLVAISGSATSFNLLNIQDTVNATSGGFIQFLSSTASVFGSITRSGATSAVLYNTTSDYRLKEDLQEIKGLEKVCAIKVYDFKWIENEYRMDGVLAHELAEVLPYAVNGEKDALNEDGSMKTQGVDYSKIVPILVKSIQEQQAQIEELKALIAAK